jgi:F0F1-type ATP synthase assembly protein I
MADEGPRSGTDEGLRGRDLIGLGGMLAGSVVGCTLLGLLLDHLADSSPAFTISGVALGMVGAAVGFWARVRSALRDPGSS